MPRGEDSSGSDMSRLQKKKPSGEKRKKRENLNDGITEADLPVTGSKPTPPAKGLKSKQEKAVADVQTGKDGIFQKTIEFFREVKVELKKVTWPTRQQTTGTTVVVIIFVFVVAMFLGLFDYSLSKLVQVVLT